ncbi:MAG: 2-C-methyl-D-erythritol 4-phosphate cytidylyltransferase [Brumimicrobium sp.]
MNTAIITAGGIGKRMNSKIPKQFLLLGGIPILMRSIQAFHTFDQSIEILVTLPKDWWSYWNELCEKHEFKIPVTLIEGGKERFHSVQKAVEVAKGEVIAVHDGVRPLVSIETIDRAFQRAEQKGSGVPVVRLKDSLRKGSFDENTAVRRDDYLLIQTPQCFKSEWIKKAYSQHEFSSEITDDATLIEKSGKPIFLTEGNEENIKITSPMDLRIATLLGE